MVSIVNTIDTGHEDIIHDAVMDFYGSRLATCSSDHTIKIFNVKNGTQVQVAELKGHYGPVWQVAWAHPKFGTILASCSYDRRVIIWKEAREWMKIHECNDHDASVNSISFAPHEFGLILACGSSDGAISIVSLNTDNGIWESKKILNAHTIGCNALSWAPAGDIRPQQRGIRSRSNYVKCLVSGGCDNLVKIWQEEGGRWVEKTKLDAHSDWVRDVAWAPLLAMTRHTVASCSQDRRVIIWRTDDFCNWSHTVINTFDDVVWNVSWSLTGNILAVAGGDNRVTLWKESPEGKWTCINDGNKVPERMTSINNGDNARNS